VGRLNKLSLCLVPSLIVASVLCGCGGGVTVTPPPAQADFTLRASTSAITLTAGGSAQPVTLTATAVNGFSGTITVTLSGLPSGVTASPASGFTMMAGTTTQVSFTAAAGAAAGTGTVQFTGASGALSHTASTAVTVNGIQAADFTLQASVSAITLTAGGSAQPVTLTATAVNGFSGTITVMLSGLPSGVTAAPASGFTMTAGTPMQVSFTAAAGTSSGTATVQFAGASGTLSHTVSTAVTVNGIQAAGIDVVTYHYDVARTGLNPAETSLTPANVTSTTFGLLRTLGVDGLVDGAPLVVSNLTVSGQTHNVVYAVTENDSVYAFDSDSGTQIWKSSVLGTNETTSSDQGCYQITPEIGITSTPVIDRKAGPNGTIFVVGMSLDHAGAYHQRLHALDLTTGSELTGSPTEIKASYPGTGESSSGGNVVFNPGQYAERASLLLLNGTIYLGWTSHCDLAPYTGWLMGYSESTLAQTSVLNLTPNGSEGSIWMSGAGMAADASGNIYFLDANGTFDTTLNASGMPSQGDFGNGFLKISTANGSLAVADYFEPFDTVSESANDEDLGSGGVIVLPDQVDGSGTTWHLVVGAGKNQNIYVANRDSMGKFSSKNNNALYQEIDGAIGGVWSKPAYFNGTVYYGAVNDNLKAFPLSNAKMATAPSVKSANSFAYPGTTPSVSANGTASGIVWALENPSTNTSPAVLHAYDATTLQEVYNSNQAANGRDQFGSGNKFITPVVANGKVFVGTPNGVAEFGLLP
jgi:hypothetical protein